MRFLGLPDPHDNIWGFLLGIIGVILSALGIVLGVWFFFLGRQEKVFSYEILSNSAVIVNPAAIGRLQVLYNGTPVPDARLTLIRISNTGNVSIPSQDFDRPTVFRSSGGKILTAETTEKNPNNLLPKGWKVKINEQENTVEIPKLLLNPGEYFAIQIISDKALTNLYIDARISGVNGATLLIPTPESKNINSLSGGGQGDNYFGGR